MDTSKEYIEMCEKSKEIQDAKRESGIVHGDYIYSPIKQEADVVCLDKSYRYGMMTEIWLPRQDQLQEMILREPINPEWIISPTSSELVMLFVDFIDSEIDRRNILRLPDSMEQLWLAFCMAELYQKVWSNGEWIKED